MTNKTRKSLPTRFPLQDYINRDYVLYLLDDDTFDILNKGIDGSFLMTSGCLDALDTLPAGSMVSVTGNFYDASYIHRERTAAEENEVYEMVIGFLND